MEGMAVSVLFISRWNRVLWTLDDVTTLTGFGESQPIVPVRRHHRSVGRAHYMNPIQPGEIDPFFPVPTDFFGSDHVDLCTSLEIAATVPNHRLDDAFTDPTLLHPLASMTAQLGTVTQL